jgi:voltage-gated potassium channel
MMLKEFFRVLGKVLWLTKSIYAVLFGLIVLGGYVIGRVEGFPFGEGFYFAMITGLTIGYGDVTVVTTAGRAIAIALGFVGIILTGMMVSASVLAVQKAWHAHHEDKPVL